MTLEPLRDLWVVDLFAGSGTLGIEALSRGALHADFVESSPVARRALEANLSALGINDRATVWPLRLPSGLRRIAPSLERADLVLLDPPYGGEAARVILAELAKQSVLGCGARVVVEHHAKKTLPLRLGGLVCERERRYGETAISFYRVTDSDPGAIAKEER